MQNKLKLGQKKTVLIEMEQKKENEVKDWILIRIREEGDKGR